MSTVELVRLEAFPDLQLHPESVEVIKYAEAHKSTRTDGLSIEDIRKAHNQRYKDLCTLDQQFDVTRTEHFVPSDDVAGAVDVTIVYDVIF